MFLWLKWTRMYSSNLEDDRKIRNNQKDLMKSNLKGT